MPVAGALPASGARCCDNRLSQGRWETLRLTIAVLWSWCR